MPKSIAHKLQKQSLRHDGPLTKRVRFTFEGEQKVASINQHDSVEAILAAFAGAAGTHDNIEIVSQDGSKLRLGYKYLKDNGQIVVRKTSERTQGALSTGAAATSTVESLGKILENWGLENVGQIFGDQRYAPRELCYDGRFATSADVVPIREPLTWSGNFAGALFELSRATVGKHAEALSAMITEAEQRQATVWHAQKDVMEVMTHDVKAVTEKMRAQQLAEAVLAVPTMVLPFRPH